MEGHKMSQFMKTFNSTERTEWCAARLNSWFSSFSIDHCELSSIFLDAIAWQFADDLKLLFNMAKIHEYLTILHNWNVSNGMLDNLSKTRTMIFMSTRDVILKISTLEVVSLQMDLGVSISSNLK